jgi:hypothetical protein
MNLLGKYWRDFGLGILLTPLILYFARKYTDAYVLLTSILSIAGLFLVWPILKAQAVPAKKTDAIGYAAIAAVAVLAV